jgi:AbrB family looped-hinge helix DNA binding protein
MEIKVKLVKIGSSLRMTVPKEATESLSWKVGDTVAVDVKDGTLVAKKYIVEVAAVSSKKGKMVS